MNDTNEILKALHKALVTKVMLGCNLDGNKVAAIEVGKEIAEYANIWLQSFAGDGQVSAVERDNICDAFNAFVDGHIPKKTGFLVKVAWEGWALPGFGWLIQGWEGLRAKAQRFLGVGID